MTRPRHPPTRRDALVPLRHWRPNGTPSCLTTINALSGDCDAGFTSPAFHVSLPFTLREIRRCAVHALHLPRLSSLHIALIVHHSAELSGGAWVGRLRNEPTYWIPLWHLSRTTHTLSVFVNPRESSCCCCFLLLLSVLFPTPRSLGIIS